MSRNQLRSSRCVRVQWNGEKLASFSSFETSAADVQLLLLHLCVTVNLLPPTPSQFPRDS